MNTRVKLCLIVFSCIVVALGVATTLPGPLVQAPQAAPTASANPAPPAAPSRPAATADLATPLYRYEVINTFPHDQFAFTEGLAYSNGMLIEGTGLSGDSSLRRVNLTTGEVLQIRELPDQVLRGGSCGLWRPDRHADRRFTHRVRLRL